ncbi:GDSL-type esterase/lipase family protein [Pontibacter sp. H249]|uniref:GDSL-type esterase/lipase family protein n=1 Tax=Pontibacter sp. H249 TaxID=3133420 RepID=UPI0030BFF8AC
MVRTLTALSSALILCLTLLFAVPVVSAPLRIMPLGNSITQANAAQYSYRYQLWKKLIDANIDADFVGSHAVNNDGNPNWPDYKSKTFDADNEGHWGWSTDQVLYGNNEQPSKGKLSQWLTGYTPDIVLMHLGTNDMFRGHPLDGTLNELREVVKQIRDKNPKVTILLAKLIPAYPLVVGPGSAQNVERLNEQLPALAQELNTTESKVILVDQYTGFNATTGADTFDGIHPNASGEEKMAQRWFDAIMTAMETLPVELLTFEGKFVQGKGVELTWKTASEEDNAYFEVQRSAKEGDFATIGIEEGAGTSQTQYTYEYLDATAPAGDIYYRLKQVDKDGSSKFSKVIHVQTRPLSSDLKIYPNRSNEGTFILWLQFSQPHSNAEVFIYTIDGKTVENFTIKSNASGSFEEKIDTRRLKPNRLYLVKVYAGRQQFYSRFIIGS